ncbi:unnamed protein product [Tilletia controversa]|uniref:Uncharacterized protein n=3 Tax=Tilletia TaxID=13289 RepID=A0A8X7SU64_9BASI|nr:hypothetical protein CF336_g6617 [Tilletia laevis]KAE8189410.1 hypothetical protein CF328_g6294 [Tilletia controversa]KAE8253539.1 hypothetical protein A4X03_0g5870 [Tilletia caries]KAE8191907.1 hypothetical protein CF335_g5968 [Tilletia laevis]KAE8242164.1 hypothetical protein A4X06_0g7173 [Tilletia controversa]
MSESHESEVHVGGSGEMTAEQLATSTQGHSIPKTLVDQAYRFLQAIGVYMKISMEQQTASAALRQLQKFVRANPGQLANKSAQLSEAQNKVETAERQGSQVKSAVGLRLVQVVKSVVDGELERATADAVQKMEQKCREEAQRQVDAIRIAYEHQLARIRQDAIEAARAEVAKGIEGFERSRAAAASLIVPEQPALVSSDQGTAAAGGTHEDLSTLRNAHNKLAEAFADLAERTHSDRVQVKSEDASELNTESTQQTNPQSSEATESGISTAMIVDAVQNLNERLELIESGQTSAASNNGASGSTNSLPATSASTGAAEAQHDSRNQQGQASDGFAEYLKLRKTESLANITHLESDFFVLAGNMQKLSNELDLVIDQLSETWALAQISHYVWASERMTIREFTRTILAADDDD